MRVPAFLAAALAVLALSTAPASFFGESSAVAAEPHAAPTYISEAGPASTRAPRADAHLPASGTGTESNSYWPAIAGTGLALLGVALIHASRPTRPRAPA